MDWLPILKKIAPQGNPEILAGLAAAMPNVINVAQLTSVRRQAYFLGQCAEESDGFKTTVEYASGKEYEGRKDLGNTQAGDGPRFKGRGLIQLTGRANYLRYGKELSVDLVNNPALAAGFPVAALIPALYWHDHGLNALADKQDIEGVTRKVNGGENGLATRRLYTSRASLAIGQVDEKTPMAHPPGAAPVLLPASPVPHPNQPAVAVAKPAQPQPGFWARFWAALFTPTKKVT
ncbi:MAG TPA: glycoside hydrolase family 19 protein [Ktedonobacterales bacterium]|nr:glycoside hydrolase family 19 protein [Ktedonobacterales bacterium]